jgi:hypothetical protein
VGKKAQLHKFGGGQRPAKSKPTQPRAIDWIELRKAAPSILLALIILSVTYWYASYGTWNLLEEQPFGTFYDALGESILAGRLDVPEVDIGAEAFIVGGKSYGYFGPTPALARIVLNWLWPAHNRRWSRLSVWLSTILVFAMMLVWLDNAGIGTGSALPALYLASLMIGSTLLHMAAWPAIYNEAISWGAALAAGAGCLLVRFVRRPKLYLIAAACLLAAGSFFARPSVGLGPMTALLVMTFWGPSSLLRHRAVRPATGILLATMAGVSALFVWLNHARFGTLLNAAPYQYGLQYNAERLARINGSLFHPEHFPHLLMQYLLQPVRWVDSFPWVAFYGPAVWIDKFQVPLDIVQEHVGALTIMPGLLVLAAAGLYWAAREPNGKLVRAILLSLAVPIAFDLTYASVNHRYMHDGFPFLAAAGAYGVAWLTKATPTRTMKVVKVVAGLLLAWAIPMNLAINLVWQREAGFFIPEKPKIDFIGTRAVVDAWVRGKANPEIPYDYSKGPPPLRTGLILNIAGTDGRYQFNGQRWVHLGGKLLHRFNLRFRFPSTPSAKTMPLLFLGRKDAGDTVFVTLSRPGRFQVCFQSWWAEGGCGMELEMDTARDYRLVVYLDRLNEEVRVLCDGKRVLEGRSSFHPWTEKELILGASLMPAYHGEPFPGTVNLADH